MAVQDIQVGVGYLHGIAGSITMTPSGGSDLATGMNHESRDLTHNWKEDEIASQDGTIIEAVVAYQESRDYAITFMPKGTTRANAEAVVDSFLALTPNKVITIAASTVSAYNGTYNYKGGMKISETREGKVTITFNARQYKDASGAFGSLALITG